MKITRKAIEYTVNYLKTEENGKYINNSKLRRKVVINPTVDGRYVLYDDQCVDSVTNNETIAILFILGIDFASDDECKIEED
jgi:hypothetical protein